MSWRGILAPELVWFLGYKHLKFPNLAELCLYPLTLIDRNLDTIQFREVGKQFLEST